MNPRSLIALTLGWFAGFCAWFAFPDFSAIAALTAAFTTTFLVRSLLPD